MIIRKIGGRRSASPSPLACDLALEFDGVNGSTTFSDTSGNAHTVVGAGNAQIISDAFERGALLLDGTGDWVTMSGTTGVGAFGAGPGTVAGWYLFDDVSSLRFMFDVRASGGGVSQNTLTIYATGGQLRVYVAGADRISGATTMSVATWYHVAWCRDGSGNARLFLNGVQEGSTYADSTNYVGATNRPIIGATGHDTTLPLDGRVDSLVVTSTALYTANFTPPTSPYT